MADIKSIISKFMGPCDGCEERRAKLAATMKKFQNYIMGNPIPDPRVLDSLMREAISLSESPEAKVSVDTKVGVTKKNSES